MFASFESFYAIYGDVKSIIAELASILTFFKAKSAADTLFVTASCKSLKVFCKAVFALSDSFYTFLRASSAKVAAV